MTQHISEFKVIRDKNQFWIHFSASGFVQCGNVDICLKMGHIIPDGDGLHQPTNAADTSLYMQRLFIGADSAASKAQSEQTRREKQPAGKLQTPECLTLCAFVNYFMFSSATKCSVYVPGKAAMTGRPPGDAATVVLGCGVCPLFRCTVAQSWKNIIVLELKWTYYHKTG